MFVFVCENRNNQNKTLKMDHPEWFENFYSSLDRKKDEITSNDVRFYNIERLPILAKKTMHYSSECSECKNNMLNLDRLIAMLPGCMQSAGERREFEKSKNRIEKHLKSKHYLRYENHYTSLFTLTGTLAGLIVGLGTGYFVYGHFDQNSILIFVALGFFVARILGIRRDRRQNKSNLQL